MPDEMAELIAEKCDIYICQIKCRNLCQIEGPRKCQIPWQITRRNICQLDCQIRCTLICQNICRIKCHIECQDICHSGITRSKEPNFFLQLAFFWCSVTLPLSFLLYPGLRPGSPKYRNRKTNNETNNS